MPAPRRAYNDGFAPRRRPAQKTTRSGMFTLKRAKPAPEARPQARPGEPVYITKRLADDGVCSRREAEALIRAGRVFIDGRRVELGEKVTDDQKIDIKGGAPKLRYSYIAYNKPRGVVTHSPVGDEIDIIEAARFPSELRDIFPLGRIDKDSRGLILLTNDGRVTKRLLSPESEHEKEYVVKTAQPLRNGFKAAIERGVDIGGYTTLPCKINLMGEKEFSIKLTEGKRHQIRRMVVALHNDVVDLRRVRVANIQLGRLREGDWRPIEGEELYNFLGSLGLA